MRSSSPPTRLDCPPYLHNRRVAEFAQAQVVLAWALRLGHAVIPSSTRRENLASNLKAVDLRLSPADMAELAALERGERLTSPASIAPAWD